MAAKNRVSGSQFNRRITIQSNAPGHDANGTPIDNWSDMYTCWADKQSFSRSHGLANRYLFSQFYPTATTAFEIRFQKTAVIDATRRVKYSAHGVDHYYAIVGVENPNEANISLFLLCNESGAKAIN